MIDPLRHNKEHFPTYEIERPSFCVNCLSMRHSKNNPNIAVVFCHECPCLLSGTKEYGALLCRSCEEDKHRLVSASKHERQLLVVGPGVRKKVLVRGDGVNFPHPLDNVVLKVKARVYNNGQRVHKTPWQTVHCHTGLSGKSLHIQVLGARGLRGRDVTGSSDPFVVYSYCGKPLGSTRVRPRSKNPRWNSETFIVPLDEPLQPPRNLIPSQKDLVKLELMDYDWITQSDLLGHVEMTRSKLMKLAVVAQEQAIRIPLSFREHHGIIHIQIGMTATDFYVRIVCAEDLDKKDFNFFNNVYVKVYLGEKMLLGSTPIVENSINPVWENGNEFRVPMKKFLSAEQYLDAQIRFYKASVGLASGTGSRPTSAPTNRVDPTANNTTLNSQPQGRGHGYGHAHDPHGHSIPVPSESNPDNVNALITGGESGPPSPDQQPVRPTSGGRRRVVIAGPSGLDALQQEFMQLPDFLALIRAEVYDRRSITSDSHIGNAVLPLDQLRKILPNLPSSTEFEMSTKDVSFAQEFIYDQSCFEDPIGYMFRLGARLARTLSRRPGTPTSAGRSRAQSDDEYYQGTNHNRGVPGNKRLQLMAEGEQVIHRGDSDSDASSEDDIEAQVLRRNPEEPAEEDESETSEGEKGKEKENEKESKGLTGKKSSFLGGFFSSKATKGITSVTATKNKGDRDEEEGGDSDEEEEEEDEEEEGDEEEGDEEQGKKKKDDKKADKGKVVVLDSKAKPLSEKDKEKQNKMQLAINTNLNAMSSTQSAAMTPTHKGNASGEQSSRAGSAQISRTPSTRFQGIAPPEGPPPDELPDYSSSSAPLSSYTASANASRLHTRTNSMRRRPGALSRANSGSTSVSSKVKSLVLGKTEAPPPVHWSDVYRLPITRQAKGGRKLAGVNEEVLETQEAYGSLVVRLIISNRGELTTGLDSAVQRMTIGESSVVKCRFDHAYGSYGLSSRIPPRSNIVYHVRLLEINGYGRFQLPIRVMRRVYRVIKAFLIGIWFGLLVMLKLKEPPVLSEKEKKRRLRASYWNKLLVAIKLRDPIPADSDSDSDHDSLDEEEEREGNFDELNDIQKNYEDDQDSQLHEKAEKFRLGKVSKQMKKHFNPSVQEGAKLLWGMEFKKAPERRRPRSTPPSMGKLDDDEDILPDFEPDGDNDGDGEDDDDE